MKRLILLMGLVCSLMEGVTTIVNPSLPNPYVGKAIVGGNIAWTLTATGNAGAVTWSITSGALPVGLSLTAGNGQISGTATTVGNFSVTIQASDGTTSQSRTFTGTTQYRLGLGCTTITVVDRDCDYFGAGSRIGHDADDTDDTVNTLASFRSRWSGGGDDLAALQAFFQSPQKGYGTPNHWIFISPTGTANCNLGQAGDAANSNLNHPCNNFNSAFSRIVSGGDAVIWRGGSYSLSTTTSCGSYICMQSGISTQQQIYMEYPGETAILTPVSSGNVFNGDDGNNNMRSYWVVDGFKVTVPAGQTSHSVNMQGTNNPTNALVVNMEANGGYDQVFLISGGNNQTIKWSTFHDTEQFGEHNLYIGTSANIANNFSLIGNVIYNSGGAGNNVHMNGRYPNAVFDSNIIYGGSSNSLNWDEGVSHATVQNNVMFNSLQTNIGIIDYAGDCNTGGQICPYDQNFNIFRNNLFYYDSHSQYGNGSSCQNLGIMRARDESGSATFHDLGHNTWDNNIFILGAFCSGSAYAIEYDRDVQGRGGPAWLATDTWRNNLFFVEGGGSFASFFTDFSVQNGSRTNQPFSYLSTQAAVASGNQVIDPKVIATSSNWFGSTAFNFNFHLLNNTSPAWQTAFTGDVPLLDIVGISRGSTPDIGPYQDSSVTVTCSIGPTSLPNGTVGTSYGTQTLTASNCGAGTLTWTVSSGNLPTGITGCSGTTGTTCALTGTPTTTVGSPFTFTIRVSDGGSNVATQQYTVTISPAAPACTITTTSPLPGGIQNIAYSQTLSTTGCTSPLTWSVTGGTICNGLSLGASTGAITGTPTTAQTCNFTAHVVDATAAADSKALQITISPAVVPSISTTSPLSGGTRGQFYSLLFSATSGTPFALPAAPYIWTASNLPAGMQMSSQGVLFGYPTSIGTASISVTVTDSIGQQANGSFSLSVGSGPIGTVYTIDGSVPQSGTTYPSLTSMNAAVTLQPGDVVNIKPTVTYTDRGLFLTSVGTQGSPIVIQGSGGRPVFDYTGVNLDAVGAAWNLGVNTRWMVVSGVEIRNTGTPASTCSGPNSTNNCRGIFINGQNLTVQYCYIHNNENGIMSTTSSANFILSNSEIAFNGFGDGQTHNLYLQGTGTHVLRNYIHDAVGGINLKDRSLIDGNGIALEAKYNLITTTSGGGYEVDMSQSTFGCSPVANGCNNQPALLVGNVIDVGSNDNLSQPILFGNDGRRGALTLTNNTIIYPTSTARWFSTIGNTSPSTVTLTNNIFWMSTTTWNGSATVSGSHNFIASDVGPPGLTFNIFNSGAQQFVNFTGKDYHIASTSDAVNAGINPPNLPMEQYVDTGIQWQTVTRTNSGISIDVGAFEYNNGVLNNPTNVRVSGVGANQVILAYTAPDTVACSVEVSESASYSPLINDVNSVLFSGSNLDSRAGSLNNGTDRLMVIGKRGMYVSGGTNIFLSGGQRYSRSLRAGTLHYYRITCNGGGQASGTFVTRNVPIGDTHSAPSPTAGGGTYNWPSIPSLSSRGNLLIDPQSGTMIRQVTQPSEATGQTTNGWYDGGMFQNCSPIIQSSGGHTYNLCIVPGGGNQPSSSLFSIETDTGTVYALSRLMIGFGTNGCTSGTGWVGSELSASFSTTDGNALYAMTNCGPDFLSKVWYMKWNGALNVSNPIPDSQTSPNSNLSITLLTPTGLPALLGAFDSNFTSTMQNNLGAVGMIPGSQNNNLVIRFLSAQDSMGWIGIFSPGNNLPIGSGGTGNFIAALPLHSSPIGRWCGVHELVPMGSSSQWIQLTPTFTNSSGFLSGAYFVTAAANDGTGTTIHIQNNGSGNPYDPSSTAQPNFLQAAQVGDLFTVGSPGRPGGLEAIEISSIDTIGHTWTVIRGNNYAASSFISGSGITPGSVSPVSITTGTKLYATCRGYPLDSINIGNSGTVYWNYVSDPHGTSISLPPVSGSTSNEVIDNFVTGAHNVTRSASNISAGARTAIPPVSWSRWDYPQGIPSYANATNYQSMNANPSFASQSPIGDSSNYQLHPSFDQTSAPVSEQIWHSDIRPFIGAGGIPSSASLIGGTTSTYSVSGPSLHRKQLSTFATCGIHPLLDISSSSTGNIITDSTPYTYCVANRSNECRSGSLPGSIYVSCPGVTVTSCATASLADLGTGVVDVCVMDKMAYGNGTVQVDGTSTDKNGGGGRLISSNLSTDHGESLFATAHPTVDGTWMMFSNSAVLGGPGALQNYGVYMAQTPPFNQRDSIRRDTFVGVNVNVPAIGGVNNAIVEFGYGDYSPGGDGTNMFCTTRQEVCVANGATISESAPFAFVSDAPAGLACASGCVVAVPGLSGNVLYYRIKGRDSGNNLVYSSGIMAVVVP